MLQDRFFYLTLTRLMVVYAFDTSVISTAARRTCLERIADNFYIATWDLFGIHSSLNYPIS